MNNKTKAIKIIKDDKYFEDKNIKKEISKIKKMMSKINGKKK